MSPNRSRRPAAAPRRKRVWARESDAIIMSAGGSNHFDLLTDFKFVNGSATPIGCTVAGLRITAAFDRTSTAADLDALWLGVCVAPAGVEAVDIAPATYPHLDWMLWTKRFISEENRGSGSGPMWEFQVRAMRKLEELQQTLWITAECQALLAGTLAFGVSTLLLLP